MKQVIANFPSSLIVTHSGSILICIYDLQSRVSISMGIFSLPLLQYSSISWPDWPRIDAFDNLEVSWYD